MDSGRHWRMCGGCHRPFSPCGAGRRDHTVKILIEGEYGQVLAIVALASFAKIAATALTLGWDVPVAYSLHVWLSGALSG